MTTELTLVLLLVPRVCILQYMRAERIPDVAPLMPYAAIAC